MQTICCYSVLRLVLLILSLLIKANCGLPSNQNSLWKWNKAFMRPKTPWGKGRAKCSIFNTPFSKTCRSFGYISSYVCASIFCRFIHFMIHICNWTKRQRDWIKIRARVTWNHNVHVFNRKIAQKVVKLPRLKLKTIYPWTERIY